MCCIGSPLHLLVSFCNGRLLLLRVLGGEAEPLQQILSLSLDLRRIIWQLFQQVHGWIVGQKVVQKGLQPQQEDACDGWKEVVSKGFQGTRCYRWENRKPLLEIS